MSPDEICRVSRYVFAFLGCFSIIAAIGWLHAEKTEQRNRLRSLPAAGTVGELLVLAGSDELPVQTWFPVSREGVLGSVRSCDLVVPCPGVKAHHLDYCWVDGIGLLIRPRSGCEVKINGVPLDCRSDEMFCPMTNGSCLQVGEAVLRLQLLKAFDCTYTGSAAAPMPESVSQMPEPVSPMPEPVPPMPESVSVPFPEPPPAFYPPVIPYPEPAPPPADPVSPPREPFRPAPPSLSPPRRSDRWKEDWSE